MTPHLEMERTVRRLEFVDHLADVRPAAPFVEARGAVVADGAGEPSRPTSVCPQPILGVGQQNGRHTRPSRFGGHVELIEFVAPDHAEPDRSIDRSGDPCAGEPIPQPHTKTLKGPVSRQLPGQDAGVSVLPTIVPEVRKAVDLVRLRVSHLNSARDLQRA